MRQRPTVPLTLLLVLLLAPIAMPTNAAFGQESSAPKAEFKHRKFRSPLIVAEGLQVNHYWFAPAIAGDRGFQVYGEMENVAEFVSDAPPIGFQLFDKEDNVLGSIVALPLYHVIEPGMVLPFRGDSDDDGLDLDEVERVEPILCDQWPNTFYIERGHRVSDVEIVEAKTIEASKTRLEIEGKVRNNGNEPVHIRVQVAVFDSKRRYVGSTDSFTGAPVPPGKTGRFTIDDRPNIRSSAGPLDRVRDGDFFIEIWAGVDSQVWVYAC